jgi:hypothetical protein
MKGQYFSFDAIIAAVIMALAITSLLAYWYGAQSVIEARNSMLHKDALRIAESLLSPGVPANWSQEQLDNIYQIGLAEGYGNVLNQSKVSKLKTLADPQASPQNYTAVGRMLKAPADYFIKIESFDNNACTSSCINISIGNESAQFAAETAVAHRGAVMNGKPVRIRVFLGR